ncbi:MAG: hypothetical protein VKI82_11295 [Leptolyngbya sp.]|nr:hypothetical protein [Leptolyngbya sp.]
MDSIQAQVVILTEKVDELHHLIDQVNDHVTAMLASAHPSLDISPEIRIGGSAAYGPLPRYHAPHSTVPSAPPHLAPRSGAAGSAQNDAPTGLDAVCEHKDVLVDGDYRPSDRQTVEGNLSQDIQIQRLTAQLTAAYHRIAALEEQLLATRVL